MVSPTITNLITGPMTFTYSSVAGVTLAEAIDMVTLRPCALLGLPAARLEPDAPADFTLFNWQPGGDISVCGTLIAGTPVE